MSAYANYGSGKIYFGITDRKERVGIADPERKIQDLENQINDNIHPHPDFSFEIEPDQVIVLTVQKGKETPYCYQGKAYKRNVSSTIETNSFEYKNLVLNSLHLTFTEVPAEQNNLTFTTFSRLFFDRLGIQPDFPNTFITLELYSLNDESFTNGALLLSDQNTLPGIDIVFYGKDRSIIRKRLTLENASILDLIDKSVQLFEEEYTFETVDGIYRKVHEKIPVSCFREALMNAAVHREWQIQARIKIEFFEDSLTVLSPGGLPEGMEIDDYLSDCHISVLRNKTLAFVFLRLGLIESLGTGIPNILAAYSSSVRKPSFDIREQSIRVTLPVLENSPALTPDEKTVYDLVKNRGPLASSELLKTVSISKSTLQRILNRLLEKNLILKTGRGPAVRYFFNDGAIKIKKARNH